MSGRRLAFTKRCALKKHDPLFIYNKTDRGTLVEVLVDLMVVPTAVGVLIKDQVAVMARVNRLLSHVDEATSAGNGRLLGGCDGRAHSFLVEE